ncbi:hypothetical protein OOK39_06985 [Streptomyces sp. NBC_00264]|uniref:hypothetical protein n=1 Tax=unclassified Streptomyces TaxID=2593676 RepID=UPI0022500A23|nr:MULTISPECIES: hypothetical protein [unclassified Streptomyces]MCX5099480.1 hypothetical protein [Streptomyces sp. NBC_00439]MCX5159026.1 hypothetical protein [Streptomyces sp. NBC_00305]MCX5217549.1 hypothetical protein [Streptomyces sp. NBC_00264]WSX00383.1 hypothetical protein OG355_08030 [Streptomyces sp. NBC_00987]
MLAETICSAVSAAGLGIAAVTAWRKRFLAATRIAAYSLVPIALVLTGIVDWAGIAFKPSVWLGFGLLAVAWLLFMTTRTIERRGGGTRKERRAAARAAQGEAVAPAASAPSLGAGHQGTGAQPKAKSRQQSAAPGEDFSDIEAILKKHGI